MVVSWGKIRSTVVWWVEGRGLVGAVRQSSAGFVNIKKLRGRILGHDLYLVQ